MFFTLHICSAQYKGLIPHKFALVLQNLQNIIHLHRQLPMQEQGNLGDKVTCRVPVCTYGMCCKNATCPPVHQGYVCPLPIPASNLQIQGNPIRSSSPSVSSGFRTVMRCSCSLCLWTLAAAMSSGGLNSFGPASFYFPSSGISLPDGKEIVIQCNPTITHQTLLPGCAQAFCKRFLGFC